MTRVVFFYFNLNSIISDIAGSSGDNTPSTSRGIDPGPPLSLALRFPNGSRNQVELHTCSKVDVSYYLNDRLY